MTRTLIKGGCVLTMHPRTGNPHRADVLIEDDKIAAVGPDLDVGDAEVVDAALPRCRRRGSGCLHRCLLRLARQRTTPPRRH